MPLQHHHGTEAFGQPPHRRFPVGLHDACLRSEQARGFGGMRRQDQLRIQRGFGGQCLIMRQQIQRVRIQQQRRIGGRLKNRPQQLRRLRSATQTAPGHACRQIRPFKQCRRRIQHDFRIGGNQRHGQNRLMKTGPHLAATDHQGGRRCQYHRPAHTRRTAQHGQRTERTFVAVGLPRAEYLRKPLHGLLKRETFGQSVKNVHGHTPSLRIFRFQTALLYALSPSDLHHPHELF